MYVKLKETLVGGGAEGTFRKQKRGAIVEVSKDEARRMEDKSIAVPLTGRELELHLHSLELDKREAQAKKKKKGKK